MRYAALWLCVLALPATAGQDTAPEIHGDWQVACAVRGGANHCALVQQQSNADKQRVLAIELTRVGDAAEGMLVLPFGLSLQKGVRLGLDTEPAAPAVLSFRTCIPAGCLVPMKLDAALVARLRTATLLKVQAGTADSGDTAVFSISLRGFGDAFDRAAALAKPVPR